MTAADRIAGDPSNGTQILFRLDLERAGLDAYSEEFEPSRKLTRDHHRAVKAAAAAVVRALADKHQQVTDGGRCCGPTPEPQCMRCGSGDEVAEWLRIEAERLFPASSSPVTDTEANR